MTNMKITFRKTIYICTVLLAIILFSLGAGKMYVRNHQAQQSRIQVLDFSQYFQQFLLVF